MAEGVFCFSVEALEDDGADLRLLPSLRYAHSEAYLARLASQHGFEVVAMKHAPVREDQGQPIEGLYVVLRRAPARAGPAGHLQKVIGTTPSFRGVLSLLAPGRTAQDRSPFPASAG